jgi:putative flippase GtrA
MSNGAGRARNPASTADRCMAQRSAPAVVGRQFASFAAVGVLGFVMDAAVFLLLNGVSGWSIGAARTVSASCSIAATWWLNRRLTFADRRSRRWRAELFRYALGQGAGLLVNIGSFTLMLWLVSQVRAVPIVALAVGASAALLFNYLTARTVAFRGD